MLQLRFTHTSAGWNAEVINPEPLPHVIYQTQPAPSWAEASADAMRLVDLIG